MEEEIRFCPNCGEMTMQGPCYLNPDEPDEGMAWCCSQCLELIDIIQQD